VQVLKKTFSKQANCYRHSQLPQVSFSYPKVPNHQRLTTEYVGQGQPDSLDWGDMVKERVRRIRHCSSGPVRWNTAPDRTGPHRTQKYLGDGIDQTPQCTGDPDRLSQRGTDQQLCPVQPRGEIHNFNHTTLDPQTSKKDRTGPKIRQGVSTPCVDQMSFYWWVQTHNSVLTPCTAEGWNTQHSRPHRTKKLGLGLGLSQGVWSIPSSNILGLVRSVRSGAVFRRTPSGLLVLRIHDMSCWAVDLLSCCSQSQLAI